MQPLTVKFILVSTIIMMSTANICRAQQQAGWPKTITTAGGTIIDLYQPEVLSYEGDSIRYRSVISVKNAGDEDPVFGVAWTTAMVVADTARHELVIEAVRVDQLRIPDDTDRTDNHYISFAMETSIPRVVKRLPMKEVFSSGQRVQMERILARDTAGVMPKVYFASHPTILVLIDGAPRFAKNEKWGLDAVVNSRSVIVKGEDSNFYIYGGGLWYVSSHVEGPYYRDAHSVSKKLRKIDREMIKAANKNQVWIDFYGSVVGKVIVSTEPAVLIQTEGKARIEPVLNTSLYHVINSEAPIFFDDTTKVYYVQTSGGWFRADSLAPHSVWQPVAKTELPVDILLTLNSWASGEDRPAAVSAEGKKAAGDLAAMDQQVPQTAKVARTITTQVDYDGAPRF
ncbi:MAG TPA: hypothetical protein VNU70_07330, partial [Puia sp.]|nr:hypothetical protein [Puia sp.]